jgi:hypothetical protein
LASAAGFVPLLFLSYTAIFFLPGVLYAMYRDAARAGEARVRQLVEVAVLDHME